MIKFANPLYYPTAILVGSCTLILGVRFFEVPNAIVLPTSVALTTLSASWLKSRELEPQQIAQKQLERQLKEIKELAQSVTIKAESLRQEAKQVLTQSEFQLDLLVAVEETCDRVLELPTKIERLSQKILCTDSLLSVDELQNQLEQVKQKLGVSSEFTRQHLLQLASNIERNIELAKTGRDTRQIQIVSLHNSIQQSAGILQQLQNQLRKANLENSEDIKQLKIMNRELQVIQENLSLLIVEES